MLKKTRVIPLMIMACSVLWLPHCDTKSVQNPEDITEQEPLPPEISSFVASAGDTEVLFSWEVPKETTAAGFLLSYRFHSAGPPWTHEIIITQNTSWTLTPTSNETPVFAVLQLIAPNGEAGAPSEVTTATPTRQIGSQVYIPSGSFTMGWSPGLHHFDEEPAHEAWIDGYWMDRYPITVAQWNECVLEGSCEHTVLQEASIHPNGLIENFQEHESAIDHPMVGLGYADAVSVCEWKGMSLPTEAQWEKAARGPGPDLYPYPWGGESPTCQKAGFTQDGITCTNGTIPVGSHPHATSPYGVHDLVGAIWQWTADWYHPEAYQTHSFYNPAGPSAGDFHVIRGGAWNAEPDTLFTTTRLEGHTALDRGNIGVRCVRPGL